MSKMGQEFERKLDEAKYDLYEALKTLMSISYRVEGCGVPDCRVCAENKTIFEQANKALAKVEK